MIQKCFIWFGVSFHHNSKESERSLLQISHLQYTGRQVAVTQLNSNVLHSLREMQGVRFVNPCPNCPILPHGPLRHFEGGEGLQV